MNSICQLCNTAEETLEHFILNCSVLEYVRTPIISDIDTELIRSQCVSVHALSEDAQIQIILDCTTLLKHRKKRKCFIEKLSTVVFHNRRLLHSLLMARYRMLILIIKHTSADIKKQQN